MVRRQRAPTAQRDRVPHAGRIAFDREADLPAVETLVRAAGGRVVEWSSEADYPALFFEDPVGTRLEICVCRLPA
jgi:hypothetical protein